MTVQEKELQISIQGIPRPRQRKLKGRLGYTIAGVFTVVVPNFPAKFLVRKADGSFVRAYHDGNVRSTKPDGTPWTFNTSPAIEYYEDEINEYHITGLDPEQSDAYVGEYGDGIFVPSHGHEASDISDLDQVALFIDGSNTMLGDLDMFHNDIKNVKSLTTEAAPDASSVVDLVSTTQGILVPRMTTTQRDAIASPAESLLIFNTTTGVYNYWDGAAWATFGDSIAVEDGTDTVDPTELLSFDPAFFDVIPSGTTALVTFVGPSGIDADAIHDNVADEYDTAAQKVTPIAADRLLIEDSADSLNKKWIEIGDLPGSGGGTGGDLETVVDTLTADVTMVSANTFYTGASVTLDPGKWLLLGVILGGATASNGDYFAQIYDGTNVLATAYAAQASGVNPTTIPLNAIVEPATSTTYDLQLSSAGANNLILSQVPAVATDTATYLLAVKLSGSGGGGTPAELIKTVSTTLATTTSTTLVPVDSTNVGYTQHFHDLVVGDIVRCIWTGQFYSSGGAYAYFELEIDQPTSGDIYLQAANTSGVPSYIDYIDTARRNGVYIFTFIATEAGTHHFRPVWRTASGTLEWGNDNTPGVFTSERLGGSISGASAVTLIYDDTLVSDGIWTAVDDAELAANAAARSVSARTYSEFRHVYGRATFLRTDRNNSGNGDNLALYVGNGSIDANDANYYRVRSLMMASGATVNGTSQPLINTIPDDDAGVGYTAVFTFQIFDINSNEEKLMIGESFGRLTATNVFQEKVTAHWENTAIIDQLQLQVLTSGDFLAGGRLELWGEI